jgi:hypothetical protein
MDVDEQNPPEGGGAAQEQQELDYIEMEQKRPKRPRVGRNAVELLQAIEKDAEAAYGWARHLRATLLHAGEARRAEDDIVFVFRRQGEDLLNAVRTHGEAAIDILFEA